MLRFDRTTYLSILNRFIWSERLSNCLWGSDFYYFQCILYNVLVILFVWFKEYIIWRISFSKFSDIFVASTSALGNLWNIYLGFNMFSTFIILLRSFYCIISNIKYNPRTIIIKFNELVSCIIKFHNIFISCYCLFNFLPPIFILLDINKTFIWFFSVSVNFSV